MDRRNQELLDKQLRTISPSPRNDGVIILTVVAVFFAGLTIGDILFAHDSDPMRIASNNATAAISFPDGAPPITRQ
jgi:hypothetical protein